MDIILANIWGILNLSIYTQIKKHSDFFEYNLMSRNKLVKMIKVDNF